MGIVTATNRHSGDIAVRSLQFNPFPLGEADRNLTKSEIAAVPYDLLCIHREHARTSKQRTNVVEGHVSIVWLFSLHRELPLIAAARSHEVPSVDSFATIYPDISNIPSGYLT